MSNTNMKVNFKVENDKGDTYEYEVSKFPSGELNVRLKEPSTISTELLVIAIRSSAISDNIMELCLLVNALHNVRELSLSLAIPYVPYSRQDRVCNEGEALSIKVFADIINSLNFANVITIDNHSDVATALLNNCYNAAVSGLLSFTNANSYDFLLSPDAGSIKKVSECSKVLQIPMLRADKMRDTMTGDITGTEVYTSAEQIKNKSILIVDDIAAGGMTFYYIAKRLKEIEPTCKITLFVTHGFFHQGLDKLKIHIDKFITTDSVCQIEDKDLTIVKLQKEIK